MLKPLCFSTTSQCLAPRPHPTLPSQDETPPHPATLRFSHTKNKWVIGHKVSASPNPLLISLWGLRQRSGCSVKLAADGRMAAVTGRQAVQAWGCLLGSQQRKYNNHTLPPLFALHLSGILVSPALCRKYVCAHVPTHTGLSCNQIVLWTYACSFSPCSPHGKAHTHTNTHLYAYIKHVLEHSSTPLVILL